MPRAFIVRPFGTKEGIDFDAVDQALIQPALKAAGVPGSTTANIAEAGNIREDMFRLLVTADLVVADLSIHNANVFYELGIRHGLRPRGTLLIRADVDSYPFDLQTDRFLLYDRQVPNASVQKLVNAIKATLAASGTDSPVYKMLPSLRAPSPTVLRVVPQDFREAVDYAQQNDLRGDLRLLAHEAGSFEWASEGLRTVGRAQFALGAWSGALETFEALRTPLSDDVETNQRLGTIYQKLGDLVRSSEAIQRVIDSADATPNDRAEAFALQGRNAKAQWLDRLKDLTGPELRGAALRSAELKEAIDKYGEGFEQDLNHFYSGLNALSLLKLRNELASALPAVWNEPFETEDDAQRELKAANARFQRVAGAVEMSIAARATYLKRQQPQNGEQLMWAAISSADHAFLTALTPRTVAAKYRAALANAPGFARESARAQAQIFQRLGVRLEFVNEALAAIDESAKTVSSSDEPSKSAAQKAAPHDRVLLFTGHMVDAPDRKTPRFPPTRAAEAEAWRMIRESIEAERKLEPGMLVGIAGGGCGGDILFHEICQEFGIETRLFLALPQGQFSATSVQHGGKDWVERYNRLCARLKPRVLGDSQELPVWLRAKSDYSIWQRNNLWMLFNALALNGKSLTLIALWDNGPADDPGGTQDLVAQVRGRGYKVDRLPAERLKQFTTESEFNRQRPARNASGVQTLPRFGTHPPRE
jgi:Tetratricopeptide Repeats-Sensor